MLNQVSLWNKNYVYSWAKAQKKQVRAEAQLHTREIL